MCSDFASVQEDGVELSVVNLDSITSTVRVACIVAGMVPCQEWVIYATLPGVDKSTVN